MEDMDGHIGVYGGIWLWVPAVSQDRHSVSNEMQTGLIRAMLMGKWK